MKEMIFRQLFDQSSGTYTYLLADEIHKEAAIIDPVYEWVARDLDLIKELGLRKWRVTPGKIFSLMGGVKT